MVKTILITLLSLITSTSIYAEEKLTQEETLQRLIETDLIKEKYQACTEAKDPAPWDCVWNKLNDNEKEQVSEILGEFTDKKKKASENQYEGKALASGLFHDKASPVMKELGDKIFDMFQEAMYGEITETVRQQELRVVDHKVFYDIYKARISKEFIELVASFCLDSKIESNVYEVPEDKDVLKKLREDNIKNMHTNKAVEEEKFTTCITQIKNICSYKVSSGTCPKPFGNDPKKQIACAKDQHTMDRACQINESAQAIKKNIAATDVIIEEIDKMAKEENGAGSLGSAIQGKKLSIYVGAKDGDRESVDSMTTITSGQLEEAMKVDDTTTTFSQAAEKLKQDCSQTLTAECKEYVLEGDEIDESKDKIAELALRMRAMENKIDLKISKATQGDSDSKEELVQFFKEEGINEEDIDKIMSDDKKIAMAVENIKANYRARTEAVINNLKEKLDKMVPKDDSDAAKVSVISQISQELMDRPKHYQQLLHYSNIVSSYLKTETGSQSGDQQGLQVGDGNNNSNRYETAAAKELANLGSDYEDDENAIAESVDINPDESPDTDKESSVSISNETINSVLYKEVIE